MTCSNRPCSVVKRELEGCLLPCKVLYDADNEHNANLLAMKSNLIAIIRAIGNC